MFVGLGYQAHLLCIESQLLTLVIHELNTLKQTIIEQDTIAQVGEHRGYLLGNLVHLVVTICIQDIEEYTAHFLQQSTTAVKCHNGILKGRFCGIGNYILYLGFVLSNRCLESRHIMLVFHFVERRYTIGGVLLRQ